uniref:Inter-alpha-trypsin inhibitor heavy chain 5 n=1 Tax=Tetraodon nigroviridis TaxID=99883 RepID=H3D524_TETNG
IQELSITTTVVSRYAFTAVFCAMLNRRSAASEAVFRFQVPAGAYVSNFTMIVGGRVFQSEVRPREKKVKSEDGRGKNKDLRFCSSVEPEMELFKMAATIPGRNRAIFMLTYEELLRRRLGRYEHVTLRPLQLVSRLTLDLTIVDHAPITQLEVLPLRNGASRASGRTWGGPKAPITFSPNIVQQARIATNGLLGDFVVRYDVQRDMGIGDVQVLDGHFVHYFAPKDLPAVPKNVVFVIDTSASMLGKKMRQTKEALLTILGDLRPADRFNFISFSSRIRVWQPGRLVPATPSAVRDAKKFVVMLPTSGGTDIDGAIQTGSSLLRDHLSGRDAGPNSVSLIIFLTDGQPTVGEVRPGAILGNARAAVRDKFCIFTIGMGDDVDYRLLERMALDNCGMMRRIPEEADASSMLKGFYDEIGTPLLSDIRVNYTQDSVQYVTQHLFTNYFNGSELVIAGKLSNQSAPSLHVQVTASNSDKSITLETDVPLRHRQGETEKHVKAGFVERVWGFLSVKEGLRSRLRSQTSRERERHIQRATNLSLTYHFLTPLTNLVVEKPGALADGAAVPPPTTADEVPEALEGAGSRPPTPSDTAGSVPSPAPLSPSADGDPHFVVEFPLSKLTVCFNINGEPGHVLRLVSDHASSGVTVNGKLSHKHQRTYFSAITVVVDRPRRAYIEVTPKKVILDGRDRMVLPCHSTVTVDSGVLSVSVAAKANVTVSVGGNVSFVVLLHQYKNPAPYQRDHLGFYVGQSKGLSPRCHGLLGQFLHEEVALAQLPAGGEATPSAVLKVKGRSVPVVQKSRRIYGGTQSVDCWFARNNAAKLIDGQYEDYLRSHMF